MKNDTTFVHMRSGDHLGDTKCRKRHFAPSNLTFLLIAIDRNSFSEQKTKGRSTKLPQIF